MFFVPPVLAATPTAYVKGILDEVMRIQNDPAASEQTRKEAIRRIIKKNFDFDQMSKDSLGATYNRLSASQRQEPPSARSSKKFSAPCFRTLTPAWC